MPQIYKYQEELNAQTCLRPSSLFLQEKDHLPPAVQSIFEDFHMPDSLGLHHLARELFSCHINYVQYVSYDVCLAFNALHKNVNKVTWFLLDTYLSHRTKLTAHCN